MIGPLKLGVPCLLIGLLSAGHALAADPLDIGARRELFADSYLIECLEGARLVLHAPHDEGPVLQFDSPWEGPFSAYVTILKDGERYRAYYRGMPQTGDGTNAECTCYAESPDGKQWSKPVLNLYEVQGTRENNVILAGMAPFSHNFCPMIDPRAETPPEERYKALAGSRSTGLAAFVSADGLRWKKMRDEPVITEGAFDSQNVPLWSEHEQSYVCYFRVFHQGFRRIARTTSPDFRTWSPPVRMEYRCPGGEVPPDHLYTNQTHPYFRAPQLYVAIAARFMPGRQVLNEAEAQELNVNPGYFKDTSDAVFMTTRGGSFYDRTFQEGFIRPGIGPQNWVSRTNYPALNVVPTGPHEMSVFVNQDYAQPTAHLRRYSLRLDGFASVRAPYEGGELLTKPLRFQGQRLRLNFSTSAAGGIRAEIQDADGKPLPGFSLNDAVELIGNEIERAVSWKGGADVASLAGQTVRLRFVMKDADLYALQFGQ